MDAGCPNCSGKLSYADILNGYTMIIDSRLRSVCKKCAKKMGIE
jgi:hypothetical protein